MNHTNRLVRSSMRYVHLRTRCPFVLACGFLSIAIGLCTPVRADDLFDAQTYRMLTSDLRAQRVGDTLTVLVVENSSASAKADSDSSKQSDVGIRLSTPGTRKDLELTLADEFKGGGSTQRNGKLLAQLSVTVVAVEANGDLRVAGEQLLEINKDKQSIKLEGRVRRADVGEANTVLSSRLADARISYVGDGVLGDAQRRGWLPRIFSFLGLI